MNKQQIVDELCKSTMGLASQPKYIVRDGETPELLPEQDNKFLIGYICGLSFALSEAGNEEQDN